jgi:hypothetical protein
MAAGNEQCAKNAQQRVALQFAGANIGRAERFREPGREIDPAATENGALPGGGRLWLPVCG